MLTGFALQRAVLDLVDLSAPEKQVLTVLAIRADASLATCTPGIARICRDTGLGERTVQRSIQALCEKGHIARDERPGRGVVYTVHPRHGDTPATETPVSEVRDVKEAPPPQRQETPATAAPKQPRTTNPKKASPSKGGGARGSRLPSDFDVPDDWKEFARKERGWDWKSIDIEAATFVDYWASKAGTAATKTDWAATWRNWVRRSTRPDGATGTGLSDMDIAMRDLGFERPAWTPERKAEYQRELAKRNGEEPSNPMVRAVAARRVRREAGEPIGSVIEGARGGVF